ncbi:MAG: hypothetical protein FWC72_06455 [Oscillospiraceae bacterium]|nr:hypothetical protein [Oscillospiraceae bacterium]
MFKELSGAEEKVLQYAIENDNVPNQGNITEIGTIKNGELRSIVDRLVDEGYVVALEEDFLKLKIDLTYNGKNYFKEKARWEKEQKTLTRRKWRITIIITIIGAIITAIIAEVIGLIPWIVSLLR